MFRFEADLKVFLHREPIDFRAGINSLVMLVEQSMQLDPFARSVFAFHNRKRNQATFSIPIEVCHNGICVAPLARSATSSGTPQGARRHGSDSRRGL
jgi:IS66 Orf2 like protein